jgi:hypothetical protein
MGSGAPENGGMQHVGQLYVVHVGGPTRYESDIFPAFNWSADIGLSHCLLAMLLGISNCTLQISNLQSRTACPGCL